MDADACIACSRRLCEYLPDDPPGQARTLVTLARGERLDTCREGCLKFWIVVRGWAAVSTGFPDGRRQITGLETAGDVICGLVASPAAPSWLEALEDCTICQLDLSRSAARLRDDPRFLAEVFHLTHQRLVGASQHLTTLGRLDSTERVILFLGQMALRRPGPAGAPVRLPMSREDIADYLGLNAETVSRVLTRLKKSKLVRFLAPTEYVVPDMAALARRLPVPIEAPGHDPSLPRVAGGGLAMEGRIA